MAHTEERVKIKMCGMFRLEDIAAVNEVRPEYCGFVVDFPKSHRSVDKETLAKLSSELTDGIAAVGVFVDEAPDEIAELLDKGVIDIAQLHGNESDETVAYIKERTGKPVIRAYRKAGSYAEMLEAAKASPADMVLLDTGQGGGIAMDFGEVKAAMEETGFARPFFLAGGITAANIREAVRTLRPYAIDLSGGLETDRLKDPAKMREIMKLIAEMR